MLKKWLLRRYIDTAGMRFLKGNEILDPRTVTHGVGSHRHYSFHLMNTENVFLYKKKSGDFGWTVNGKVILVCPTGKFPM